MWAGETPKNVASLFRTAVEQDAVLLFDEADAIAARRFSRTSHGLEREANTTVNVLLCELEGFNGVVIFATNLAANFDSDAAVPLRARCAVERRSRRTRDGARRSALAHDGRRGARRRGDRAARCGRSARRGAGAMNEQATSTTLRRTSA